MNRVRGLYGRIQVLWSLRFIRKYMGVFLLKIPDFTLQILPPPKENIYYVSTLLVLEEYTSEGVLKFELQ